MTTTGTEGVAPRPGDQVGGGGRVGGCIAQIRRIMDAPVDAAGLSAFRFLFGMLMVAAVARLFWLGWLDDLYAKPSYHFTYLGFDWVRPWPGVGLYLHFGLIGLSALCLALGVVPRVSAFVFFLLFSYAELLDKSAYLNHYYLVSLLALLLVMVPSQGSLSFRGWGARWRETPAWTYWLFRAQLSLVYFYAGFAKLNTDWLFRAQPLRLWLGEFADLPFLGAFAEKFWLAQTMSWGGMMYDLSVAPLLLFRKTRKFAVVAAIGFHLIVWMLFPIGIFPWVMILGVTLFFDPVWPRTLPTAAGRWIAERLQGDQRSSDAARMHPEPEVGRGTAGWLLFLCAGHLVLQTLLPLRFVLYPGFVNWTEEGFRFSWRVMLIEKAGQVEYRVVCPSNNERFKVHPRRELSKLQVRMMSTQPDMIHQYAQHLAERTRAQGCEKPQVFADAWVSLNGRSGQRLVDPEIDLALEPRSLSASRFILPLR